MVAGGPFRDVHTRGVYALPARGEWVKTNERMTTEEYLKYAELFNPDMYDPKQWARAAKNSGMKYLQYRAIFGRGNQS